MSKQSGQAVTHASDVLESNHIFVGGESCPFWMFFFLVFFFLFLGVPIFRLSHGQPKNNLCQTGDLSIVLYVHAREA